MQNGQDPNNEGNSINRINPHRVTESNAQLYTMDWTEYLELFSKDLLTRIRHSSHEWGQQPPLPAVFVIITHDPPAAADRDDTYGERQGKQRYSWQ